MSRLPGRASLLPFLNATLPISSTRCRGFFGGKSAHFSENCGKAAPILAAARNPSVARQHRNDATAMRKKTRGLVLLVLAYIAFFPIEFSVAQDPPRANLGAALSDASGTPSTKRGPCDGLSTRRAPR